MADEPALELPSFSFSPEEIAAIKAEAGVEDVDEAVNPPINEVAPPKRRRGRPPGRKNLSTVRREAAVADSEPTSPETKSPAIPLTKRDEKEVAKRLANILSGATGMTGVVKPYFPMTDEEAQAIAEPLASYLIRNEPTVGIAREILDNYDIVAMVLGVGSYGVRVYSDRKHELDSERPTNTTAVQRISERSESNNGRRPDEESGVNISVPSTSFSGPTPFDV